MAVMDFFDLPAPFLPFGLLPALLEWHLYRRALCEQMLQTLPHMEALLWMPPSVFKVTEDPVLVFYATGSLTLCMFIQKEDPLCPMQLTHR